MDPCIEKCGDFFMLLGNDPVFGIFANLSYYLNIKTGIMSCFDNCLNKYITVRKIKYG
jgi:hypothetical protein